MPRSHWKGSIVFGLVNIPIVLHNTIDPKGHISFKQINIKTGEKIHYKRIDNKTQKEVPWEDIAKGYEYSKDEIIPISSDELKRVSEENNRKIKIEEFIDKKNIDFIHIEHSYYLIPDSKYEKGYIILREALKSSNKIGIAKVIISTKEYLAAISTYQDILILYLLHYHEEIRELSEFDTPSSHLKKYKITPREIDIAKKLILSMSTVWHPEKYQDDYKKMIESLVKRKLKNLPALKKAKKLSIKKSSNMVNFIDLLKKSLNKKESPQKLPLKTKTNRNKAHTHHYH